MKDSTGLIKTTKGEITYSDSTNKNKSKEIAIPSELIDTINKVLQENFHSNNSEFINKERLDDIWKVIINPELQNGIDNGNLFIKKGSLEIRNVQTGRIVGKAKLNEVSIEEFVNKDRPSSLSKISRNIASISGQLQMAEISKKLDVINEKIDLIGEFLWREKVSQLQSLNSVIEEAIESLPNKNALSRINDCVKDLSYLSDFFNNTIENLLNKDIKYSLLRNFVEGYNFREWRRESRTEYNKKYNNDIKEFISEYGFLLELYHQSLGLIGTCYQLINEYPHASKYYSKIESQINHYSTELAKKLVYLLNIDEVSMNKEDLLLQVNEKLKTRKLSKSLLEEFDKNNNKIEDVKNMHKSLVTQFDKIQISYDVDSKLLMEGIKNG